MRLNYFWRKRLGWACGLRGYLWIMIAWWALIPISPLFGEEGEALLFNIRGYMVEGNSLLAEEEIDILLGEFTGKGKNAETVNQAREALEKLYHNQGYPAVLVNIPLQSLENDMVKLQVVESRIGKVRVTGNTYFTMKRLLRSLPSILPGKILYLPHLEKELVRINRNRHIKVAPVLSPGKEFGTIDVELKVKDKLPLHGSLEVNNYSTHTTTDLRSAFKLNYDNFWQRDHSLSLQVQTSPEDLDEVKVVAGSYVMGSFLNADHMVACYGVWSDSDVTLLDDLRVMSKGNIFGARYIIPLPPVADYYHNLTLGVDYKDFKEVIDLNPENLSADSEENEETAAEDPEETPDETTAESPDPETETETEEESDDDRSGITYLPVSLAYGASFKDPYGQNQISAGLGAAFRGLVTDQREFEKKRFKARASYLVLTASYSREHEITEKASLYSRVNVQLANMPLISNEQFVAGGANSVRGYKDNEVTGDSGVTGVMEIRLPDGGPLLYHISPRFKPSLIRPYLFYDIASLNVHKPLPGNKSEYTIQGTGLGVRGNISPYFKYQFDMGYPLVKTENVESGDVCFYFKVSGEM